jgi:hypothetical protein
MGWMKEEAKRRGVKVSELREQFDKKIDETSSDSGVLMDEAKIIAVFDKEWKKRHPAGYFEGQLEWHKDALIEVIQSKAQEDNSLRLRDLLDLFKQVESQGTSIMLLEENFKKVNEQVET